jgi:hypothetical protein
MKLPQLPKLPLLPTLGVCLAVFLVAPYVPNTALKLTVGNMVGTFVALGLALLILRQDMVLGLAAFLAVTALFLENRRRVISRIQSAQSSNEEGSVKMESAPPLVPGEVHPDFDTPSSEDHPFEPETESGSNKFEPVDESLNEKGPLPTVRNDTDELGSFFQQKGLAPNVGSTE